MRLSELSTVPTTSALKESLPVWETDGSILLMYLLPEDYAFTAYTEIYLTVDGALAANSLGDDYDPLVDIVKNKSKQYRSCAARQDMTRFTMRHSRRSMMPGIPITKQKKKPIRSFRMPKQS